MVKVERLSENRVKLVVTVSAEQFDLALDAAFEKVVKDVKVDGFRPGKLPKSIYISRFGWESLYNEGIEFAFQSTYGMALQEAGDYPVDDPKVDLVDPAAIEKGKSFDYTVEVDVWPNVHLGEYKGVKVKKQSTRVLKKDVEAYINNVLKGKAENVVKEDAAVNGDTVVIDFEGFIDDVAFEGGKGENYPLELGSNSFIPGFEEQLVGTKAGDSLDVNVTFPKDYHAELASKAAVFKVTVHEVKTKVVPELTDDFVKELEIEGVNTVDEYKKHVQAELNEHAKAHSDEKYTNDLVEKACANTNVNIPECMIEDYAKDMKASSERQAAQYNIPFEMYLQYMGYTLESFEKQAKEVAVKRIKADLVLSKIAEAEKIKVTPEELQSELKKLAEDNSMELAEVQKRVNLNQLAINLEQSKVIDVLKANAVAPAKKTKKEE